MPSRGARARARAIASAPGASACSQRSGAPCACWRLVLPPADDARRRLRGRAARDRGGVCGWTAREVSARAGAALLIVASACLCERHRRAIGLAIAGVSAHRAGPDRRVPDHAAVSPFRPVRRRVRARHAASAARRPPIAGRVFSIEDLRWGYTFYDRVREPLRTRDERCLRVVFSPCSSGSASRPTCIALDWQAFGAAEGFLDALDVEFVVAPWLVARGAARSVLGTCAAEPQRRPRCCAIASGPGRAWVAYGASVAPSEHGGARVACSPRASIRAAK